MRKLHWLCHNYEDVHKKEKRNGITYWHCEDKVCKWREVYNETCPVHARRRVRRQNKHD